MGARENCLLPQEQIGVIWQAMENAGARGNDGTVTSLVAPADTRTTVFGHAPFSGNVRLRLEASGRLALPSAYKSAFATQARIRAVRSSHLLLWTEQAFDVVATTFATQSEGVVDPRAKKGLYMSTPGITIDKQSRFVIPPELREQVGLGEDIVLAGAIESIEIWPARAFQDTVEPTFGDADLFFDGFSGLPTDLA